MFQLRKILLSIVLLTSPGIYSHAQGCKDYIYFKEGAEIQYKTTLATMSGLKTKLADIGTTTYLINRVVDSGGYIYSFATVNVRASSCDMGYQRAAIYTCENNDGLDITNLTLSSADTSYICDVFPEMAHKYRYYAYQHVKHLSGTVIMPFTPEVGKSIPGKQKVKLHTFQRAPHPQSGRALQDVVIDGDLTVSDFMIEAKEKIVTLAGEVECFKLSCRMELKMMGMPMSYKTHTYFSPTLGLVKGGNERGGIELIRYKLP